MIIRKAPPQKKYLSVALVFSLAKESHMTKLGFNMMRKSNPLHGGAPQSQGGEANIEKNNTIYDNKRTVSAKLKPNKQKKKSKNQMKK